MRHLFDKLLELLPVIGLAAFGGLTRTVAGKERNERYRLRIAVPEILIAIFSGLLIHWLTLDTGMSDNFRTAAIALAGYSARSVIAILNAVFLNMMKKNTRG
ncbi:phage holin family protein [Victivallis vadensis]|uniref:phage holin family protein n=1 Tax=Victivallis vadensis TaxID=172901 RepID=UPI0023F8CE66|nr:phage holin family protein [Victivallis vadensis]